MNALIEAESELREEMTVIPDALDAYWPSRIREDRVMYGQYVVEDERFFAPNTHVDAPPHVYRLTNIEHDGDTFTLEPCAVRDGPSGKETTPVSDPEMVSSICELAGALELGELVHLPDGVLRSIEDTAFLSMGETTIAIDDADPSATQFLRSLDPPNGPASTDVASFSSALDSVTGETVLYVPEQSIQQPVTDYRSVQPFSKWTFEDVAMREWVESQFEPGDRILNACAGETKLTPPPGGEIIRNDVNPDRDADLHVDVGELAAHLEKESFDLIIFDPPWSLYQSNLRYSGNHVRKRGAVRTEIDLEKLPFETPDSSSKSQLGHARLAKENFHWLLKPGGRVAQITFHGTAMPARLRYVQEERVIFDPVGEAKCVIGSIDRKTNESAEKTLLAADTVTGANNQDPQQTLGNFS